MRFPAQKFRIPLSSTVIRIAHSVRDARAFSTFLQALLHAFSFERLATFFVWVINILAPFKMQAYSSDLVPVNISTIHSGIHCV